MSIRMHSAVIMVNDVVSMKNFYHQVMGLAIENDFGACVGFEGGLSIWELPPEHALCKRISSLQNRTGRNEALEICFETEEFDTTTALLKQAGVEIIHDVLEENWGQYTIRFYDPEKNIVELGESIAQFVSRMHNEGMSIEQIGQKTGVPMGQVRGILGSGQPHLKK